MFSRSLLRGRGAGAPVLASLFLTLAGCLDTPLEDAGILDGQVLLQFEGRVANGDIVLEAVHGQDADGNEFDVAVPGETQALTRIREDKNNDPGSAGEVDGIELIVERTGGFTPPGNVVDGCGPGSNSFDVTVTVRNFFTVELSNTYAEINTISVPGHELCNSDKATPNLQVADDGTSLAVANGLVRYGNLLRHANVFVAGTDPPNGVVPPPVGADTTAQAMLWRFKNADNGTFSFRGRVVADVCQGDCTAGAILQEGPLAPPPQNALPFGDVGSTTGTAASIDEIVEGAGVVYVVGDFNAAGPRTGTAFATTRSTSSTGAALPQWAPFVGGEVRALEPDGQGGFFAGGAFTQVGNVARSRLVHIKSDGSVDTAFVPAATLTSAGEVRALYYDVAKDVLWVGRSAATFLAAIKGTTGADAGFNLVQPNDQVFDIVAGGTRVVVTGEFRNYNGLQGRDKLIAFSDTGALQSFSLAVDGNANISVDAAVTDGSTIWFGGEFTTIGGQLRNRLAAVTIANSQLQAWNPNADGTVTEMAFVPGTTPVIVIAGLFGNVRGTARERIAALNADPTATAPVLRAWNPGVGGTIDEIFFDAGQNTLYAGGSFTAFGGASRPFGLGAVATTFDTVSPTVRPWNPVTTSSARHAISVDTVSGRVLVGGLFSFGGYSVRNNVAAFDLTTGALLPFVANTTGGGVHAAALSGNTLYLGGTFTAVNGAAHTRLAAVDATSGDVINTFNASAGNNDVLTMTTSSTHLYAGGTFTSLSGSTRNRVGRFTLAGALDGSWNPNANNPVHAIAVDGTNVFLGGQFSALGGVANSARRLARVSSSTPAATLTDFNVANTVQAISINRNVLYFGGIFTTVNGATRNRVAAIDLRNNTLSSTFVPNVTAAAGNGVKAISAAGSSVVLGGNFTAVGGVARLGAAVVDGTNGALFTTNPLKAQGDVRAVGVVGRVTFLGGVLDNTTSTAPVPIETAGTTTTRSLRSGFVALNAD